MNSSNSQAGVCYVDSSALVKRYFVEVGTKWLLTLCHAPDQIIAVAEIGLVEIAAALAGKLRGRFHRPESKHSVDQCTKSDLKGAY